MKIRFLVCILSFIYSSFSIAEEKIQLEKIQVLEHHRSDKLVDFLPSITTLKGNELRNKRQSTIGETLQNEAGVNSTNFGPNASRPVIRGQDGARIRVLQNGLGTLDASTQSEDHNIPIDPLLVDQIEIVRGPMSLLYGSSAVGGVVNVVTNRIHQNYSEGLLTEFMSQAETVNRGISNSARLDFGQNNWMIHLDGSTKNFQNQSIPGYARSSNERTNEALEDGEVESFKKLTNSESKQDSLGTGLTKFFPKGFLGLSYNFFKNDYGAIKEQAVDINMQQNRLELIGEYKLNTLFEKIKLKSTQSNYRHKEIEDGEVGTIFKNQGNESRLELINKNDQWQGVTGLQSQIFAFNAQGDEAFLPKTHNQIFSFFSFQEYHLSHNTFSLGGRIESTDIQKVGSDQFLHDQNFSMENFSGSLGHLYKFNDSQSLATTYSYTERAPSFQELFAKGAHVASGIYEQGSTTLGEENVHGIELSFKQQTTDAEFTFNVYTQFFEDYIFLTPTGSDDEDSGLPINDFKQVNALFYGLDLEGKQTVLKSSFGDLKIRETFDFVRAKNTTDNSNLPRISPARLGLGLEYSKDQWSSDIGWQYVFKQTKVAALETNTEDYILTNIGGKYTKQLPSSTLDLFLRVRNIFNEEARNHVSTLKEVAPLPGRNFILGFQWLL